MAERDEANYLLCCIHCQKSSPKNKNFSLLANTRYFHCLASHGRWNYVEDLFINSQCIKGNEDMRDHARGFFQHLYEETVSNRPRLDNLHFKQLSENNRDDLKHEFMEEEILEGLKECNGYFIYFLLTPAATCKAWLCWFYSCGFIVMAFPRILFFAAFLLLLSFWVDLCHQADHEDEEDDDPSFLEALLKKSLNRPSSSSADSHRICFPFRSVHVGSRQKIVILVTVILVLLMMTFAMLIWVGMGSNSIDSSTIEQVYINLFAIAILLLGGALACYGIDI